MKEQILSNARLVLDEQVVNGSLVLRDGRIADIAEGPSRLPGAEDCGGDYLMPGLIELHTDNMEKYFQPRPKVAWPQRSAAMAHDAQMAASGITTVFDALSIGDIDDSGIRIEILQQMCDALTGLASQGLARIDHRLHLRCELCHPDTLTRFLALADHPKLGLVSLMDHAPGQRQFTDIAHYRTYYKGKYRLSDEGIEAFIVQRQADSARYSDSHRQRIAEESRVRGLSLASHDDATEAHIEESHAHGCRLAEFPTTLEAARAARRKGLAVIMGAPNIIRGGSHSGNVAARELMRAGLLDVLSSDYYPASLLDAVFAIARSEGGYDLPRAVGCATHTPAEAVGLHDRGRLAAGLRGDLLRVAEVDGQPLLRRVWSAGNVVH
ncbi:alpha-D-ribose 1-methylphosphonate 5-triphosphate diphosphatase [Pseudomonas schmalbachii]|uniref:Alpha-D-ribose 1-methylphosphonate 5-triphosphate diphosphatase n=1 Tax=Pseudomonas schmalbachii TaxID=2816993 RepID=A0ABS3TQ77_9PSED|nr:alpha-D-ribose 1-methylphosphonate 5-triphosphate diphosphatase [Pseudomonas schmalbachii]MBO3275816.1 alpha-D-ribose 1-methylphosphonate 5-triphosphate diphosphatase [Pseudomonas schmalbachii]